MAPPNPIDVQWTPKMFEKLVERYVFRPKITENFKEAISLMNEDHLLNTENGLKLLKLLFEKGEEVKEIYGTPEALMNDLFLYQNFPCNAEFLGVTNSLNYHSILNSFESLNGQLFSSTIDAYIAFVHYVIESKYKITSLLAKSIGNFIGRYKKNTFDLISFNVFDCLTEQEKRYRKILECDHDFKYETIDDVYTFMSQYYNKERDVELLAELRKMLNDENERHPIAKNLEHYEGLCAQHAFFDASIRKTFITTSTAKKSFLHNKIATARIFDYTGGTDANARFFFAKELENALIIGEKKYHGKEFPKGLFPVETEEDRKLGILRIVKWQTYLNVLKIRKLPMEGVINIVVCKIKKTNRDNQVPINTPYGTYCILANRAVIDVFTEVTLGMQLFRRVNKENATKVIEWFENLDIFDESRKYSYCVETWKVDEIIDRAYQELEQYSTEPIHKLSKTNYGRHEILKELLKFSPNFPNQSDLRFHYEELIKKQPYKKFPPRHVHQLYDTAIFFAFVGISPKFATFMAKQVLSDPSDSVDKLCDLSEQLRNIIVKH